MKSSRSTKDLISITDLGARLNAVIRRSIELKRELKAGTNTASRLKGKSVILLFEKPSTRTRVSFEVACHQLGSNPIFLNAKDIQIGRGETVEDTGRVLERYAHCIVFRANSNSTVKALAQSTRIPVINALDDVEHPCQAVADLMTMKEHFGELKGLKVAYVGDGNNVCHSLMLGCAMTGANFIAACPAGYEPRQQIADAAAGISLDTGCRIEVVREPEIAVRNVDVIYTDVWVSMGQEKETEQRERIFMPYQVNEKLVKLASKRAVVMHCLPAHRGLEITSDVIDGPRSLVFDQAENRLHTAKALMLELMSGSKKTRTGRH
ncbi:MAG: ornithine carbamoyltransferase [Methanomassiliicoccales archaeon]